MSARLPRCAARLRVALGRTALFTTDVSPGGFCAEALLPAEPGTVVAGSIALFGRDYPFTGEVVWSSPSDPRRRSRGKIGVRFSGIENRFFHAFVSAFPP